MPWYRENFLEEVTSKLRKKGWVGADGEETISGGGKSTCKDPRADREPLIRELKLI